MAKGELLTAATAATAIGGAYKFGEFLYKAKRMRDVGPSNAVYVRLIKRIRADLDEVKRLLTVPECKDALEANPPKAKWVYGAMRDVRGALENITPLTERVGGDIEDGRRVGIRHRLHWLLSEKEKLENREKELTVAHASLTEVIGFLTALEPSEPSEGARHSHETHNTRIDVDIRRDGPERVVDREVWVDREDRGPRRVEERDVYIEHERAPRRVEERYYEDRHYDVRPERVEEREFHVQRDPRDPRHVEAQYYERGPGGYYDEKRYEERRVDGRNEQHFEERRFDGNLPRRPESFEDRVPERDTFMQSDVRRQPYGKPPYDDYAEYGAPQPSGAAQYSQRSRFSGDPGFGDEIVVDPAPVPPQYEREVSTFSKHNGTRY
jgi:hypothetical protein